MNKSTRTIIMAAALAGLYAGSLAVKASAQTAGTQDTTTEKAKDSCKGKDGCKGKADKDSSKGEADKASCKGMNDCKGKGGCKTSDNGCKGKNTCKGKGGCSSKHAEETPKAA